LVGFVWARRGRKAHPDRDRTVISLQAERPLEARLLIAGKREETDDGFVVRTGTTVPRAHHISVCLPGEILVSVIRKDELDQPGGFLYLMQFGV
jgi:type V secretory pathway adhesin AidA